MDENAYSRSAAEALTTETMLKRVADYLIRLQTANRLAAGLARAAAVRAGRRVDPKDPGSWEFSAFSQNGEDGIIDYLVENLHQRNRYFIEIGVEDGLECNGAWLAIARKFSGLMVEGNPRKYQRLSTIYSQVALGVQCISAFITRENAASVLKPALFRDPDVCSVDVDGNDFYIAASILNSGIRPKIFVVEYNSAFGPNDAVTIEYREDFNFQSAHPTQLYFGVSVSGWRKFFAQHGYSFVTVDSNGVNAFFVQPNCFDEGFLSQIQGYPFKENFYQLKKFKQPWAEQLKKIEGKKFVAIP